MKKILATLLVIMLIISLSNIDTAYAGSASVSFSSANIYAGKTYTITYTLSATDVSGADAGSISVGGVFSKVSGGANILFGNGASNTTGSITGTIKVKVSASATPGQTGTISASGGTWTTILYDGDGNVSGTTSGGVSGGKTYTVKAPVITPVPTPTPIPTPTPVPTPTPKPTATPDAQNPKSWSHVQYVVKRSEDKKFSMNIKSKEIIPIEILEILKEDEKTLTLVFDDYSCTVDGSSMSEYLSEFEDIDIGFTMEKDEELSKSLGIGDVYAITFNHHGELPCPFIYKIKAEGKKPGDEVYLYYIYEKAGIIEAQQKIVVDEDGYITFQIYHSSIYIMTGEIIEDAANNYGLQKIDASLEALTALETTETPAPSGTPTPEPTKEPIVTPVAGNTAEVTEGVPILIYILSLIGIAMISTAVTMMVTKSNKKNEFNK